MKHRIMTTARKQQMEETDRTNANAGGQGDGGESMQM
jgi:hypothetical protein